MGGSDDANGDNDGAEAASQLTDVLRALEENDETPEALASVHVIIDEVRTFACTSEFHPILHDIFRLLAPGQRADMLEALNPASERDDVDIAMLISSDELSASLMHEILRSQENDDESQRVDEEIQMLLNTNAEAVLLYKRLRTWMLEQERSALLNDISIDEWGLDPEGAFYVERALTSDVLPEKAKSAMRDQVIMQTLAWATDPLGSKLILRAFQTGGEESRHLVSSMLSVCLATVAADVHGRKLLERIIKTDVEPCPDKFNELLLSSLSGDASLTPSDGQAWATSSSNALVPLLDAICSNFDSMCECPDQMQLLEALLTVDAGGRPHRAFDEILAAFVHTVPRLPESATTQLLTCVRSLFTASALSREADDRALSIVASCFALVTVHLDRLSATKEGVAFIQSLCSFVRDSASARAPKTSDAYDASVAELARLVLSRASALEKTPPGAELARWKKESREVVSAATTADSKK